MDDMRNDVLFMIEDGDTISDALAIYTLAEYADEWKLLSSELPEQWQAALNQETQETPQPQRSRRAAAARAAKKLQTMDMDLEQCSEASSVELSEEESSVDEELDDEEYEEEEYDLQDDEVPEQNTEEKATFKKGLQIFKSVTGERTFYPLLLKAMYDGNCSNNLEEKYLDRGQYVPVEYINVLLFYMTFGRDRDLGDDVWLYILEFLREDARRLRDDVMMPKQGSTYTMFRSGVIFYTTWKRSERHVDTSVRRERHFFSGYLWNEQQSRIEHRSMSLPLSYSIDDAVCDEFGLKQQMLRDDWTLLMPKCDAALRAMLRAVPRVVQLFWMMLMFGKEKNAKALRLLNARCTSKQWTMHIVALIGHLFHEYFYRELQAHVAKGVRRRWLNIQHGPKRRTKRKQVRCIFQLLNGDRVGFNMWPKKDRMTFDDVMRVVRKDLLTLNVLSRTELDDLLPWKDDAFDWQEFRYGFYHQSCDYSRYNPMTFSLGKADSVFLTLRQVPESKLVIRNFRGWHNSGWRTLPRSPQHFRVRQVVHKSLHKGLTPELLDKRLYELPMIGNVYTLFFPKRLLRCYVDGQREELSKNEWDDWMRKVASNTLDQFAASATRVYLPMTMDRRMLCVLVLLRMFLKNEGALHKRSDSWDLRKMIQELVMEYRNHLHRDGYEDVHVAKVAGRPWLPAQLNTMISKQYTAFNDIVATPLQYMAYRVNSYANMGQVAYTISACSLPVDYCFYSLRFYKEFVLLTKRKMNAIGWLQQHQNLQVVDDYKSELVTLEIDDGKPKVNAKMVSWPQFLRCLLFLRDKEVVPEIKSPVFNEDYRQKPFQACYWLRADGMLMKKTMALNTMSKLLRKRPRYLEEWKQRIVDEQEVALAWKPEWGHGAAFIAWQGRQSTVIEIDDED